MAIPIYKVLPYFVMTAFLNAVDTANVVLFYLQIILTLMFYQVVHQFIVDFFVNLLCTAFTYCRFQ